MAGEVEERTKKKVVLRKAVIGFLVERKERLEVRIR